ncbi:zinc-dependent peptidase [Flavobacterium eburneipallidum]|uniref:zinc-dependent peptidase n=1 Tax=Flavobacterium eburneipallidum TaxID=3003263 RepID=UPI0024828179|nr:zinc-dependent peptidase [Flavobacterium eburneipallidum]
MVFQFLVLSLFGFLFLLVIIFRIVEPAYILIFNKPLYLYFYLIPKKLTSHQKQILEKEFPFYKKLPSKKKIYFEHRVKSFITQYKFIGKEELVITDEIKITIAGTYIQLTFGMRDYLIGLFKTIVVYPKVYYSNANQNYHKGEFNPRLKAIIFSWEDFLLGHATKNDNINLGFHEFSHVLHLHCLKSNEPSAIIFYDGLNKIAQYFNDENLRNIGYFREYAFENQFEFLAVVFENFFETPQTLKTTYPELYAQLVLMINLKE